MNSFTHLFSKFVSEAIINGLRQGFNLDGLFKETGVSLNQLHQPDFQLSINTGIYIVYRIYEMSKLPGIALRIGAQMRTSDYGFLGLAVISAPSIAAALGKLHNVQFGQAFPWEFTLVEVDNQSTLLLNTNDALLKEALEGFVCEMQGVGESTPLAQSLLNARRHFLEVGLMMARSSWIYAGKQVEPTPLYINLSYPQPAYSDIYQRYFNCPVYFSQANNAIVFRSADLRVKPVGSNPDLLSYSEQQLDVSSRQAPNLETNWAPRTRAILTHGGVPFLEAAEVAKRLSVSSSALRRHLADENTSFRQQLQNIRESLAKQYLEREELAIFEVANLMGYSETAAFSRSFKQWTGLSPKQYRENEEGA